MRFWYRERINPLPVFLFLTIYLLFSRSEHIHYIYFCVPNAEF